MIGTQRDRVLRALHSAGPRGITAVDFQLPTVIDGGAPILRLAARIKDLRDEGHAITVTGERHGCAVYELDAGPAPPVQPTDVVEALTDVLPAPATAVARQEALF